MAVAKSTTGERERGSDPQRGAHVIHVPVSCDTPLSEGQRADSVGACSSSVSDSSDEGEKIAAIELAKKSIVHSMVGTKRLRSLDRAFAKKMDFIANVYKSFVTGIPQHCTETCPSKLEPSKCCWIKKKQLECENSVRMLANFQRDITTSISEYLKEIGKTVNHFPRHCDDTLTDWILQNNECLYMPEKEATEMAKRLGLSTRQIKYRLANIRSRKWKGPTMTVEELNLNRPAPTGRDRKSKHCHHPAKDISELKAWGEKHHWRSPTRDEKIALSEKTMRMTPEQVNHWFNNYKKRYIKRNKNPRVNKNAAMVGKASNGKQISNHYEEKRLAGTSISRGVNGSSVDI